MGIEPITHGLKDRYSSQLSYGVNILQQYRDSNPNRAVLETT